MASASWRRLLKHPDTSRCAQGALMVAQELMRGQRAGGQAALQAQSEGLFHVMEHCFGRVLQSAGAGAAEAAGAAAGAAEAAGSAAASSSSSRSTSNNYAQLNQEVIDEHELELELDDGIVDDDFELPTAVGQERAVPSTPARRVVGFGQLAAGLAAGTVGEAVRRGAGAISRVGEQQSPGEGEGEGEGDVEQPVESVFLSGANSERLASTLCRMRGAALKLGQMLSIQDETVLPPQLSAALDKVRQSADVMPRKQLDHMLVAELGADWEATHFESFNPRPFAAASLGQVHQAMLKNPEGSEGGEGGEGSEGGEAKEKAKEEKINRRGRKGMPVAVKVQFPGVADSIDSDLGNLKRLADVTGIFPRGLFIDRIVQVMKQELREECDYEAEAHNQARFREMLRDDRRAFFVPKVYAHASSGKVLTSQLARGEPIDVAAASMTQAQRNRVGRRLLRLSLRELVEFQCMQTDPNFSNYLYDAKTERIVLLDFGAVRSFRREFVQGYLDLVWASAQGDRSGILEHSIKLGFLTGEESQAMTNAHIDAGLEIGRPFQRPGAFDFRASRMTASMSKHGDTMVNERLTPPPREVYSLHRKLAGAYMMCIRIGAVFPCRDLLERAYARMQDDSNEPLLEYEES